MQMLNDLNHYHNYSKCVKLSLKNMAFVLTYFFSEIFGLTEYYQNTLAKQKARLEAYNKTKETEGINPPTKREREDEEKEAEEPVEKKLKADE